MTVLITNIQGYSIHDGPGIRTVVFFKGCSLACQWCSNPECISGRAELGFFKALCTRCGRCLTVCPEMALTTEVDQFPRIDRNKCTGCGKCAESCYYKALNLYGQAMSVDEVFEAVKRDKMFYDSSGGGITLSGGEVLLQPDFVRSLLDKCRAAGLHTCVETSGCGAESALRLVIEGSDLVLYDLKHLDTALHQRYTGQSNDRILANAEILAQSAVKYIFRVPLIPGVNDDPLNIRRTAGFAAALNRRNPSLELMPFHKLGKGKYDSLDRAYPAAGWPVFEDAQIEQIQRLIIETGVECTISR
jgi:pyruvate formate lyase activating enzyme